MSFFPHFVCALLGVDSLRGGLAEGNRITSQRLLDQSQAGVYRGKRHIHPPILAFLGLFAYPTPRGVHNLLMQFFTPGSSKIEVFETCFHVIVIP